MTKEELKIKLYEYLDANTEVCAEVFMLATSFERATQEELERLETRLKELGYV